MTNSPFDDQERPVWEKGYRRDERFQACLTIDLLLVAWPETAPKLARWGYQVKASPLNQQVFDEVRRFLADWTKRMDADYVMVSIPPDFAFPARDATSQLIENALLPHCREFGLPFALMPGVRRAVNPQLRLAGDGVGLSDLSALQNLCAGFPENKFMVTVLARENQHELCVLARKFRNLHIFGCWWFTNVPYGTTSLKQLLALIDHADLLICPDSGPAHMATTVGTPVVGLYATSNRRRTGPYFSQHLVVDRYPEAVQREFGVPIADLRWGQRVRDPRAMDLIQVSDVIAKVDRVLTE